MPASTAPPPSAPPAAGACTAGPDLGQRTVEAELHIRRWHLGFAPEVEARFEADTAPARRRGLLIGGLVALLVYNLFLINDLGVRPEVFSQAALWRLGCLTPFGTLVLLLIHRGVPAHWREGLMASTILVAIAASSMILWHTRSAAATYDLFVFSLVFMAGNIVFPLRFVPALASSSLALLIAGGFALLHPTIPKEALPFALGLLAGTAVFSVLACHRIEAAARHSYLLALREELRSTSALQQVESYARLSQTDELTQIANRRAFDAALAIVWAQSRTRGTPLALLMLDIDHFKRFNDRYGHPAGDACLRRVAAALRGALREQDLLARLGGEEFAVLLPGAGIEAARATGERLRWAVESMGLVHEGNEGAGVVTLSIGLALMQPETQQQAADLLSAADQALYQAKRSGRNRCAAAMDLVAA